MLTIENSAAPCTNTSMRNESHFAIANGTIDAKMPYFGNRCPLYLLLHISQNTRQLTDAQCSRQAACTRPIVPANTDPESICNSTQQTTAKVRVRVERNLRNYTPWSDFRPRRTGKCDIEGRKRRWYCPIGLSSAKRFALLVLPILRTIATIYEPTR